MKCCLNGQTPKLVTTEPSNQCPNDCVLNKRFENGLLCSYVSRRCDWDTKYDWTNSTSDIFKL